MPSFTVSVIHNDLRSWWVLRTNRSETYNQVQVRYILSQKGELNLMNKMADLLNGKLQHMKSYGGYNMVVNLTKLNKVIDYLNKFPLKTKKHRNYLNWIKVYEIVIAKGHYNQEKLNIIKDLMRKINQS